MSATSAHQDLSFLLQDDSDRQRLLYNGGGQGYGASAGGGGDADATRIGVTTPRC